MTLAKQIDAYIESRSRFRASEFAAMLGITRAVAVAYLLRAGLSCDDPDAHDPVFEQEASNEND